MPVYHLVFHTYGSWDADNPRGYIQRGTRIISPPNRPLAEHRRAISVYSPYKLPKGAQQLCIYTIQKTCNWKGWRLHAVATDPTHVHMVVSWRGEESPEKISAALKRQMSLGLRRVEEKIDRSRFSRGFSKTRIKSFKHLNKIVKHYLPDHHQEFWCEEMGFD